jgi:hypothetical protein
MNSNTTDSGAGSKYQTYKDDDTKPVSDGEKQPSMTEYMFQKMDGNIETIKDDVGNIKYKIDIDHRMLISDIAVGVLSSLIVSVVILT